MSRLVVVENLSLDGVMQAPGRPDEDRRGGFAHGGWAMPFNDPDKGRIMAGGMAQTGPMLFGRTTYEDLFKVWSGRTDNPFSEVLDNAQKYVVSSTLTEPLPWQHSTLIASDVVDAVVRLKAEHDKHLLVMGSGSLVRLLARHGLVDDYVLLIHPLILGSGRRLFDDAGTLAALELVDAQTTGMGVVIATYRRVERATGNTH